MRSIRSNTAADQPAAAPAGSDRRLVDLLLVLLTAAAGATDAVAYLGLGGVFTANMTGNLVLFGIAGAHGADMHLARAGIAVIAFTAGLVAAYRITDRSGLSDWLWHPRISAALGVNLALQTGFLAIWAQSGAEPGRAVDIALVALSGAAMGLQTATARRIARAGITTTFVTGTLTSVAESLSHGSTKDVLRRCAVLLALVAGALAGAVTLRFAPVLAAAIAPTLVLATLVVARRRLHGRRG
ncbi:YoaK family protein [Kitasatospora sp. NPDC088351]|uniref:YoaK family protein n=1 Tax=unclassified Kitasatospora TaxID=2633591 RepID=UPI00342C4FA4